MIISVLEDLPLQHYQYAKEWGGENKKNEHGCFRSKTE